MSRVLISRAGKKKIIEVSGAPYLVLCAIKIFFPPNYIVRLGSYTFLNKEINPFIGPENNSLDL